MIGAGALGHVPRLATAYTIDMPDESAARTIADALIERGHTVVSLAPRAERGGGADRFADGWRVVGLDEGPYPSADEAWWQAVEERVVAGQVRRLGGVWFCSSALPATARRFLISGSVIVDRTVPQVREQRLAALGREPAQAAAPSIIHRLKSAPRSAGPRYAPIALSGLDAVDWASLSHAYGSAEDVPSILRALAANDEGWDEARHEYYGAVVHQGSCYSATPETIRFLVQLACSPELTADYRPALLADLAYMATLDPSPAAGRPVDHPLNHQAQTCQEIIHHLPALLGMWPQASAAERAWLIVLAALEPAAADPLIPEFRGFRNRIEGPSPALDLALALLTRDHDGALDLTLQAAAWDERIWCRLETDAPLRARHLTTLIDLATGEFAH